MNRARITALLGCALLLFARIAEPLHFAGRSHGICAEHGEVVEGAASDFVRAPPPASAGWAVAAEAAVRSEGHDHCLTTQGLRFTADLATAPTLHPRPADGFSRTARPRSALRDTKRLLHDAPKASPPV